MNCVKCGKPIDVGWLKENKVYCTECIKSIIPTKDCSRCAYLDWKFNLPETAHCKKLDLTPRWTSNIKAVIWDRIAKQYVTLPTPFVSFPDAEQCVHYVDKEEYRKKAFRGEIETKKETHFVTCKYCGLWYDVIENPKCPNCGAINR
jgi:rubrerythrin